MSEDVQIRSRDEDDLRASVRVLRAVHDVDGYPVNLPVDPVRFLDVSDLLGAWVARDAGDGAVLGHVALRSSTSAPVMAVAAAATGRPPGELAVVARLLVAPWARRRGIGQALLAAAARHGTSLGRQPVLDVVSDGVGGHSAAVALYERVGWLRCGEVEVTFGDLTFDELVFRAPPGLYDPQSG